MPVRIYTLAKELKLDSAELVTICTKAGITGKGSPLASLTDDEVAKLKTFLAGKAATGARPAAPVRAGATTGAPADGGVVRREDYIAPTGTALGKPPVLEPPKLDKAPLEAKKKPAMNETLKAPPRTGPAIKLARLPTAQTPPPPPGAEEPAPQKPDLKLPADAIRASKSGSKPLSEHLRKHEEKRKADSVKPRSPRPGGPAMAPPATPDESAGKERRRGAGGKHAPAAKDGAGKGDDFASSLGGREARQLARKRVSGGTTKRAEDDEPTSTPRRVLTRLKRSGNVSTAAPRKTKASLTLPTTVRGFSEAIGVPAREVLGKLLAMNRITTIGADLDAETAELLALELGVELEIKKAVDVGEEMIAAAVAEDDNPELLQPRPPVITFLGHVDHGKTSLLDKIIGIDVVSGESGGITQHIRAYEIERNGHKIAFVDTPGHEAFTAMRARGANVTDIAVLVVAADDGVMPQTEEAISHARAAGVPIVIALNKIDLPGVNENRIFEQLAQNELLPTEWGGDTELVRTSAVTGRGIDQLLETLLTIAELHDWRANPDRSAIGTCLEAEVHEGRGVVAKLIVQKGTLHVGDAIVCGAAAGHVKAMYDTLHPNEVIKEAGPSTPVNVTGFDEAPAAGEHFYVLDDIAVARQIADKRRHQSRRVSLGGGATHVTLETLFDRLAGDEFKTLNIIIRADVRGSIEAIRKELTKLEHPEVKIKVLQATVGGISEADVHLADASDAIIIGFNVVPDEKARLLAERQGVQIRRYDIIYRLTEDLKAALEGMLKPEQRETDLGRALVQRTFTISRVGTIAGCRVLSGVIQRNSRIRVIRDNRIIGDYALDSLKREKDDAREVREGLECGIKLAGFNDVKEGDILEAYKIEEVARTF